MYELYTPLQSGFQTHIGSVHYGLTALDLSLALTNSSHVVGYGLLVLLVLRYWGDEVRFYPQALILILFFSLAVECTQLFFVEGHCRLRDILANFVGVSAALLFHYVGCCYVRSNGTAGSAFRSWLPFALQVGLGIGLNLAFKRVALAWGA